MLYYRIIPRWSSDCGFAQAEIWLSAFWKHRLRERIRIPRKYNLLVLRMLGTGYALGGREVTRSLYVSLIDCCFCTIDHKYQCSAVLLYDCATIVVWYEYHLE